MSSSAKRDRRVVSSPYLHKLQRRHFLLFDILPILGTAAAAVVWWLVRPPTTLDLVLFFTLWAFTGFSLRSAITGCSRIDHSRRTCQCEYC